MNYVFGICLQAFVDNEDNNVLDLLLSDRLCSGG